MIEFLRLMFSDDLSFTQLWEMISTELRIVILLVAIGILIALLVFVKGMAKFIKKIILPMALTTGFFEIIGVETGIFGRILDWLLSLGLVIYGLF